MTDLAGQFFGHAQESVVEKTVHPQAAVYAARFNEQIGLFSENLPPHLLRFMSCSSTELQGISDVSLPVIATFMELIVQLSEQGIVSIQTSDEKQQWAERTLGNRRLLPGFAQMLILYGYWLHEQPAPALPGYEPMIVIGGE